MMAERGHTPDFKRRRGKRPAHARGHRGGAKNIPDAPLRFLPYQSAIIAAAAAGLLTLVNKSRRTGVTWAKAYETARYHLSDKATLDTWASSRDEPTAKLFARTVAGHARGIDRMVRARVGETEVEGGGGVAYQTQTVGFPTGTSVYSLASNPDVFAGKGGRVILDEHALRKDPEGVYSIASPCIDWGGTLAIISTQRGSGNFFNLLVREIEEDGNPKGFDYHKVTLERALDEHLLWKQQTIWSPDDPRQEFDEADYWNWLKDRAPTYEAFLQEYCCVPDDDDAAFISYDMLMACAYREGERWDMTLEEVEAAARAGRAFYGGLDVARTKNLTAFTLLERVSGGRMETRARIDLRNTDYTSQKRILWPWVAATRKTFVDATGLGGNLAEDTEARFGRGKVTGWKFTAASKAEIAYPLRAAMEDVALGMPFDRDLQSDFRAVKKQYRGGNVLFVAENTDDNHADRFWSYALALAASAKSNPIMPPAPHRGARGARRELSRRRREAAAW